MSVIVPIAVLAAVVMLLVLFFRRGRDEAELGPRGLLRLYLYLGSLAGTVLLAIGIASALSFAIATTFGPELAYGAQPVPFPARAVPPGQSGPSEQELQRIQEEQRERMAADRERRRQEDLVRGITFVAFGLLFWGAHRYGRKVVETPEPRDAPLRRAHLLFATLVFGLSTIVLLPQGLFQALSLALVPRSEFEFRAGAGDQLSGGLAALPFWVFYLREIARELRPGAAEAAESA